MWLLILLFGCATVILGWTLFAYFITIWFIGLFREQAFLEHPSEWPKVTMIVPCYNERDTIERKVKNISELDYPVDSLQVLFVDGGSTDGTVGWLEEQATSGRSFQLLRSPDRGKIAQINYALGHVNGTLVINSDADALLAHDALKWLVAEFRDPRVGLVGAYCRPTEDAYHIDRYYWDAQNRSRFIEGSAESTSIVVAPCYAFRADLIDRFPHDVIADDVYLGFYCHSAGMTAVYSAHATAVELRNPRTLNEFLPHKFRKANAFLRESLRFVYRLPEMTLFCKIMFLTRIAQQLLFPWALASWMILAGSLLTLYPEPRIDVVALATMFLFLLFLLTSRVFKGVELPDDDDHRYPLGTVIKGWLLTTLIILATGVTYPFFRQTSSYTRLSRKQG